MSAGSRRLERTLTTLRSPVRAAAGSRRHRGLRLQGVLLPLPEHGQRPPLLARGVVYRRYRAAPGGALFCQQYFDGPSATEAGIRAYADSLYDRADWQWASPRGPAVSARVGTPDSSFIPYDWRGYNEAMLLYVLALGSPTHPGRAGGFGRNTPAPIGGRNTLDSHS